MNIRIAVGSVAAFCLTLAAGGLLFRSGAPSRPVITPGHTPVVVAPLKSAAPVAHAASTAVQAPASPAKVANKVDGKRPVNVPLDLSFKFEGGAYKNNNGRTTHVISGKYGDGTVIATPNMFNASVQWKPTERAMLHGKDAVYSEKPHADSVATLEITGNGEADPQQVKYKDTYAGTDERMYLRPDGGIEHDIVLNAHIPGQDNMTDLAFGGNLTLSKGLSVWSGTNGDKEVTGKQRINGSLQFKNSFGNTVYILRPAYAYDAEVMKPNGRLDKEKQSGDANANRLVACAYDIDVRADGISLAVVTPGSWLASPDRAYPVVIDPNLGPFGLSDGNPPTYVASVSTNSVIDAYLTGTKMAMEDPCPFKADNDYAAFAMPFAFDYYGVIHQPGDLLFVHMDGFASWVRPYPKYDPPPFGNPAHSACYDVGALGQDANGNLPFGPYPDDAMYPYWDDMKFSSDAQSGIYYFIQGTAPDRQVVFEWYRMAYVAGGNAADLISFNLVLYECDSVIQFNIKKNGEKDRGLCSIGIENATSGLGIQYCANASRVNEPELNAGTELTFTKARVSNITVTSPPRDGCRPLAICFTTVITAPPVVCGLGSSLPPSYGFDWDFQDNSHAFTQNPCHTWNKPGIYNVTLTITDEFGSQNTLTNITVNVCDVPPVVLNVTPQGGQLPLNIQVSATTSNTNVNIVGGLGFVVEQAGNQNEPGQFTTIFNQTVATSNNGNLLSATQNYRLDTAGIYRVQVTSSGTDKITGLATTSTGTAFVYVEDPAVKLNDSIFITDSYFTIDWKGKLDGNDPDGLPPNVGSAAPGAGLPDNPLNDTMSLSGVINLPGSTLSTLAGEEIILTMNGVAVVFDGFMDASGSAVQNDPFSGLKGTFKLDLPSGKFSCTAKGDFAASLNAVSLTENRILSSLFHLQIGTVYSSPGDLISYRYVSQKDKRGNGIYHLGNTVAFEGVSGAGHTGGSTQLVSGGFMATDAKFRLEGGIVYADIKGLMARLGGDDIRPATNSDVIISIGNFTEALNFGNTPGFKTQGKPPAQRFTYKRPKSAGKINISALGWVNKAGSFSISTFAIPNELVGIDPALGAQNIRVKFTITPENGQIFRGDSTFQIIKVSDKVYSRSGRK